MPFEFCNVATRAGEVDDFVSSLARSWGFAEQIVAVSLAEAVTTGATALRIWVVDGKTLFLNGVLETNR